MKDYSLTKSQGSPSEAPEDASLSAWYRARRKNIAFLTLPLLLMATVVEYVILATGWKYQQLVCLPQGMGVTFFHIGPIGATILAVELLKLPLAIWTASRQGWTKAFMLVIGLPLICVLTFQLVKDMAVYEMGVAMTPASQFLEKAMVEETKISQLTNELAAIEQKRTERERKLTALTEKHTKAKADLEDSLKRNSEARQDAITLTDYQKKELAEVESRQASIIKQFNADTEQLNKAIAELRARRETEVTRNTEWNAEEARIENAYKAKMTEYANKKAAYDKARAEYDGANFLKRQLMKEPVSPGVPPERETNKVLKPTAVAEIDALIKAKEAELLTVNNKRRESVAQVDADARRLRGEFDRRSSTKREESDRKREELSASLAALAKEEKAEREAIDQEFASVLPNVDRIRTEIDACRKRAEGFYEEREASIRKQQVCRIATTVEIVRGLIMGERPASIKNTAKERGDILTDQISMVRIWVYPVLAFIVAFLPTLMVELGFSTIFKPEKQRPPHRLGFLGRRMHWLYTRAGRLKILRAERMAREASTAIAGREQALAAAQANADKALFEKEAELQSAREAIGIAAAEHEEQLQRQEQQHAEQIKKKETGWLARVAEKEAELQCAREAVNAATAAHKQQLQKREEQHAEEAKKKEAEWVAKLAGMADTLNRTVLEKDALRDLQKSEIDRQIQMRQNAWSDRLSQLRQELDSQRAAAEAERTALLQEQHQKLMEVTEDCKTQVIQARRQAAAAELAAVETNAKLSHDLKEALHARDAAEAQLKKQADSVSLQLAQAREDTAREVEKAVAQEKHRSERQQAEFEKVLRQREEAFEHRFKQREQEFSRVFDARLAEEKTKVEQDARRREAELERQLEVRARELDARWKQDVQQRDEAAQVRLKQREQQLQAQAEAQLSAVQAQAQEELRRQQLESEHQLEVQSREAEARLREELQQKELAFHAKLKQREQELAAKAAARETELQNQWTTDLRAREEEWQRQVESRVGSAETRLGRDLQQKEELFQTKLRQREQQLQSQFDARQAELRAQWEVELRGHEQEWERKAEAGARDAEARWTAEMEQKEELFQSKLRQRDQQWQAKLDAARVDFQAQAEQTLRRRDTEAADARSRALRELEATLRNEMRQKDEAAHAAAREREADLIAQLTAQAEARHMAAQSQWETEAEKKARAAIEPFKVLLARAEMERDEAKQFASESARQAQNLEKKLTEVSTFLSSWRNGKDLAVAS